MTAVLLLPLFGAPATAAPSPGVLHPPDLISHGGDTVGDAEVAVAEDRSAMAVWRQSDSTNNFVWASRSTAGSPWSDAVRISSYQVQLMDVPHVAAGPGGTFLAIWGTTQSSPTFTYSWFSPQSGWSSPAPVAVTPGHNIQGMSVAVDALGNGFALFKEYAAVAANLSVIRYTAGVGWGSVTLLETGSDDIETYSPHIATDAGGNATVVWTQFEGGFKSILGNRYTPGTGWTGEFHLENDAAVSHQNPVLAGRPSGEQVVAWRYNDPKQRIATRTFSPGGNWSDITQVEGPSFGSLNYMEVAFAGTEAVVVWGWNNGSVYEIRAATGLADAWGAPVTISDTGNPMYPLMAGNAVGGTAVAIWPASGGLLWASRFVQGEGWSEVIGVAGTNPGSTPNGIFIAVGAAGDAVISWGDSSPEQTGYAQWLLESTPPALSVSAPQEATVTANATVRVDGTTEPGAWVAANGVVASVDASGRFTVLVPLAAGANSIAVVARDPVGNERWQWRNVTFDDPTPGLLSELAAAQAQVASLSAQLAATQSQLAANNASLEGAIADLSAAQAAVTALESNATASQSELAAARANVTAANARLTSLEAAQVTLTANLTVLRSDLDRANDRLDLLAGQPGATNGDSGLALILAAVAVAVGFAGLAAALVMGGRVKPAAPVRGSGRVENPSPSSGSSEAESTGDARTKESDSLSRRDR